MKTIPEIGRYVIPDDDTRAAFGRNKRVWKVIDLVAAHKRKRIQVPDRFVIQRGGLIRKIAFGSNTHNRLRYATKSQALIAVLSGEI